VKARKLKAESSKLIAKKLESKKAKEAGRLGS
jgi:hypothetical protein